MLFRDRAKKSKKEIDGPGGSGALSRILRIGRLKLLSAQSFGSNSENWTFRRSRLSVCVV